MYTQHIKNFVQLGNILNNYLIEQNELWQTTCKNAFIHNGWYTKENIELQIQSWVNLLQEDKLNEWLSAYTANEKQPKNIGIICAGNIPLVGLHDLLCTLLSGHNAKLKLASDDTLLMQFVISELIKIDSVYKKQIQTLEKLNNIDALIATGSNNSARYFEYYFKHIPKIIRKNRNSIAIVTMDTTDKDLDLLSNDIFYFFGLGCRNVSKLYLEKGFDLNRLFNAFYKHKEVVNNKKYGNNYDYNRAILLMKVVPFLENAFLILKEDKQISTPVAVLNYEYFELKSELETELFTLQNELQCIVSNKASSNFKTIKFGESQNPQWHDYADNIDTLRFLNAI